MVWLEIGALFLGAKFRAFIGHKECVFMYVCAHIKWFCLPDLIQVAIDDNLFDYWDLRCYFKDPTVCKYFFKYVKLIETKFTSLI